MVRICTYVGALRIAVFMAPASRLWSYYDTDTHLYTLTGGICIDSDSMRTQFLGFTEEINQIPSRYVYSDNTLTCTLGETTHGELRSTVSTSKWLTYGALWSHNRRPSNLWKQTKLSRHRRCSDNPAATILLQHLDRSVFVAKECASSIDGEYAVPILDGFYKRVAIASHYQVYSIQVRPTVDECR